MNQHLLTIVLVGTSIVFLFSCQRQQAFFQRSPVYQEKSSALVVLEQSPEAQEPGPAIAVCRPATIGEADEPKSVLLADNSQRIHHSKTTIKRLALLNQRLVSKKQNVEFALALSTSKESLSERRVQKRLSIIPTRRIGSAKGNVARGIGSALLIIGIILGVIGFTILDWGVISVALFIGGVGYLILEISSFVRVVQTIL